MTPDDLNLANEEVFHEVIDNDILLDRLLEQRKLKARQEQRKRELEGV